jgi:hypothetical protein
MPKPSPDTKTDFRFPLMDRILLGASAVLIWALLLGGLGLVAALVPGPEWMIGVFLLVFLVLFTLLANVVVRDFLMKQNWRLTLGEDAVTLNLPSHRLLFGRQPAFAGTIPFADIKAIEWREEATESFDLVTINHVYALRLKDGGLLMLGEDRPIPRTNDWTTHTGDAVQALARALGAPIGRLPMARGKGGFLTLWGASRPPWPKSSEGGMGEDEERRLRNRLILMNFIPGIVVTVLLAVYALANLGG